MWDTLDRTMLELKTAVRRLRQAGSSNPKPFEVPGESGWRLDTWDNIGDSWFRG